MNSRYQYFQLNLHVFAATIYAMLCVATLDPSTAAMPTTSVLQTSTESTTSAGESTTLHGVSLSCIGVADLQQCILNAQSSDSTQQLLTDLISLAAM